MIHEIIEKVYDGERLTGADARRLFAYPNVAELGMLANAVRQRRHPEPVVTYNVGRNINYTNICWVKCDFCAFYRAPGSDEGYVLPHEEIFAKIQQLVDFGGDEEKSNEILMQGGLNPKLRLDYYERLHSEIRERFPSVHQHCLSATEILYIAHISRLSLAETIRRLHAAGLDSIPGAGAEILVDKVRDTIGFRKDHTDEWIEVHRIAHGLGIHTTATMMYGHVETTEHRIEHLQRIRDLQDETGGFTAFITWNFQPDQTDLGADPSRWAGMKSTGYDHLRTVAVSRLFLDNIENLQASWVTQGPKIAQVSLRYGINDFGSTMLEENVVSAAGTSHTNEMDLNEMERLIKDAGYESRRRNTRYQPVSTRPQFGHLQAGLAS
ncbi:MAG: cyclic dehypoxanthinyl futalosine synthase [Candidatus Latescibacterota bacterium]|nr:cyclic dehypoxanthinyl futalosine synthase [Candidatus Latescibacterota bacterium]